MDTNKLYEVYWEYRKQAIKERKGVLTFEEWLESNGYEVQWL